MNRGLNSMVAAVAFIALLLPSSALQASPAPTGVAVTAAPVGASSDVCKPRPPGDPIDLIYAWLDQQQDPVTGLLGDQQDTFSRDYVNTLGVMAFSLRGDLPRAKKILDTFWGRAGEFYHGKCSVFGPGCMPPACGPAEPCGFFQDRNSESGEPYLTGDRWMGDNVWLLMAIHNYQARSGDTTYAPMAQAIADLLKSLQQPAGYIATGWTKGDTTFDTSAHAEGNLDAYHTLMLAGEAAAAERVKVWLDTANPEEYPTINFKNGPLDLHTWRVLSLGKEYGYSLGDIERTDDSSIRYKNTLRLCDQNITGFVESPVSNFSASCGMDDNIWAEGTGEAALAFYRAGYKVLGDYYTRELGKLLIEPAGFPGMLAMPYLARPAPNCPGLEWADPTKGHVSSTAWYVFARERYDPYADETIETFVVAPPIAKLEAENADAHSDQGYRLESAGGLGVASEGRVAHLGDSNSGWAEYKVNLLSPVRDATIRLQVADDVAGDVCRIIWDGVELGSFTTVRTGGWREFILSDAISMGSPRPGLHTLRIEVEDKQTYGMAIDFARIDGQALQMPIYLPMLAR